MNAHIFLPLAVLVVSQATFAQTPPPRLGPPPPPPPARNAPAPGQTGGPLAGLTSAQVSAFRDGLSVFRQIEIIDSGLGPIFNDVSCIACHNAPAIGGASRRIVTRFGLTTGDHFDPLTERGGSLLQARAIDPAFREIIPPEANTVARRVTTPLFGAGLIDAIPDATLIAAAAAQTTDGVHGRVSLVNDVTTGSQRVGRFGWKAQQATLLAFAADAYVNEMGITNRFFPEENAPNGNTALLARADQIQDPEDQVDATSGKGDVDRVADFMRLLAAPVRKPANATILAGERTFTSINCTACHTPALTTGVSPVAALANKNVPLYSDLLLHDMGTLGDGITQGTAGPRDMRTAPLWGLGLRQVYLHDGRTSSLDAAIKAHDGEATAARTRYTQLPDAQQKQLLAFLQSL
ncbi:MAG TPA: di-heme oxidoredictase family protein [Rariglobus sp.]|nr:di-heme oxidoredictase family protein [Rariglobus sp.]